MSLPTGLEPALAERLVTSPFTRRRFWDERPVLALVAGDMAWLIRDRAVFVLSEGPDAPPLDTRVDAVIRCSAEDLVAMGAGRAPASVSYRLGGRSGADRRKQACALLALAALGWCGPWPDATADPDHVRLVRAAHYDLGIGPTDGVARLFPEGGPLPDVTVRLTHGAQGIELVTVGLADVVGRPELATVVPGRGDPRLGFPALRSAALAVAEGALPRLLPVGPRILRTGPHPRFPDGLALPNQATWLVRVGWA